MALILRHTLALAILTKRDLILCSTCTLQMVPIWLRWKACACYAGIETCLILCVFISKKAKPFQLDIQLTTTPNRFLSDIVWMARSGVWMVYSLYYDLARCTRHEKGGCESGFWCNVFFFFLVFVFHTLWRSLLAFRDPFSIEFLEGRLNDRWGLDDRLGLDDGLITSAALYICLNG